MLTFTTDDLSIISNNEDYPMIMKIVPTRMIWDRGFETTEKIDDNLHNTVSGALIFLVLFLSLILNILRLSFLSEELCFYAIFLRVFTIIIHPQLWQQIQQKLR